MDDKRINVANYVPLTQSAQILVESDKSEEFYPVSEDQNQLRKLSLLQLLNDQDRNVNKESNLVENDTVVGIDFGTSYTRVGYFNPLTKKVEVLRNKFGKTSTPSWVSFDKDGLVKVGEEAQQIYEKSLKVFDIKRIIGK